MNNILPSQAGVLDVGCGTGSMTVPVNTAKNNIISAVEPEASRALAARQQDLEIYNDTPEEGLIRCHSNLDAITFAGVFGYLAGIPAALTIAKKVLKPGESVIGSVQSVATGQCGFDCLFWKDRLSVNGKLWPTHLRRFTRRSLIAMIEREGFKILGVRPSTGWFLSEYGRFPFRLLSQRLRRLTISKLAQTLPGLSVCQYVARAVPE